MAAKGWYVAKDASAQALLHVRDTNFDAAYDASADDEDVKFRVSPRQHFVINFALVGRSAGVDRYCLVAVVNDPAGRKRDPGGVQPELVAVRGCSGVEKVKVEDWIDPKPRIVFS